MQRFSQCQHVFYHGHVVWGLLGRNPQFRPKVSIDTDLDIVFLTLRSVYHQFHLWLH